MDGDDRRASQYGHPYQTTPNVPRPPPSQVMAPPTHDRYSQPTTPARDDPRRPAMTGTYLPSYGSYGYPPQQYTPSQLQSSSPMSGVEMHYQSGYMPESSRHAQIHQTPPSQSYGSYQSGPMLPSGSAQSMYDQSLHYQQQRQNAAVEVMTSQFQFPPYMAPGDHGGVAVQHPPPQYVATQQDPSQYATMTPARSGLQPPFVPSSTEYPSADAEVTMEQQQRIARQREALDAGLKELETQLKSTFNDIATGRVREAAEKVLALTRWLGNSVVGLAFHHDDETKNGSRLRLWRELNLCWESLGLKQKTIIEEAQRTQTSPSNYLTADGIMSLMEGLIGVGDQLEPYGLVDYEMGLWEEQITHVFGECLDLMPREGTSERPQTASGQPG